MVEIVKFTVVAWFGINYKDVFYCIYSEVVDFRNLVCKTFFLPLQSVLYIGLITHLIHIAVQTLPFNPYT